VTLLVERHALDAARGLYEAFFAGDVDDVATGSQEPD
jgi:hypothetical protein